MEHVFFPFNVYKGGSFYCGMRKNKNMKGTEVKTIVYLFIDLQIIDW